MDIRERVIELLNSGRVMSLGTVDEGGVWVADVIYTYDKDFNIYWMSDPKTRHSQAIGKNNKVAGTITASNNSGEPGFGIQFAGSARMIREKQFSLTIQLLARRKYKIPSKWVNLLKGDVWYKLVPSKIELIDEENFGYDKQELNFN